MLNPISFRCWISVSYECEAHCMSAKVTNSTFMTHSKCDWKNLQWIAFTLDLNYCKMHESFPLCCLISKQWTWLPRNFFPVNCLCVCVYVCVYVCVSSSVMSILCSLMDCSPPGSSVHGILQARILECVAMPFSRGSSWPTDLLHYRQIVLLLSHQGSPWGKHPRAYSCNAILHFASNFFPKK